MLKMATLHYTYSHIYFLYNNQLAFRLINFTGSLTSTNFIDFQINLEMTHR